MKKFPPVSPIQRKGYRQKHQVPSIGRYHEKRFFMLGTFPAICERKTEQVIEKIVVS
jgi:hypothetical protein